MSASLDKNILTYHGSNYFRQRLVLAVLSQRSIVVSDIRSQDVEPGLRDFEADFLKLITEITNGEQSNQELPVSFEDE